MDTQADRVIDRLLAERKRAEGIAAGQQGAVQEQQVQTVEEQIVEKTLKPARRSAIQRIIEEKGEVSPEDLQRLIAKDVRRGI